MCRRLPLVGLLALFVLLAGACWPWEDTSTPPPLAPTATPAKVEQADQSSPAVAGRLLYAREGSIWLRTGTTAQRLTEISPATQPSWSLDGSRIAFVVVGEGYSDIWVMNADGGDPHPLTNNRSTAPPGTKEYAYSSFWAFQPQWLPPDGLWIGYISHPPAQYLVSVMAIWVIRPDGTEAQRYLPLSGNIENPTWSPDGQMVAFTFFSGGAHLRYYDLNSDMVMSLGEDVAGVERYDPAWSADGQWIAYAARQGGKTDLWVMPSPQNPIFTEKWAPAPLTEMGAARGPAWSPSGDQIAFVAEKDNFFDLWLLKLKVTPGQFPQPAGVEALTSHANVDGTSRPSWAPSASLQLESSKGGN